MRASHSRFVLVPVRGIDGFPVGNRARPAYDYSHKQMMNSDPRYLRSSYKWLVVAMLWFVCFFNYADRQAIFSVFPLLKQQLQLTDVQLGVVGASFMWMYALFGPFAGWLSDRLPRKTLVLGALIFWSFATAATALCHSYPQLVLCRALGGLGEAFYFPAAMSLIGDYHGATTRSRAMSLHQSAVYAGSIAGGAVSGFVGQYYGWSASFLFFGGAGILLGLVLWGLLDEPVRGLSEPASSFSKPVPPAAQLDAAPAATGGLLSGIAEVLRNPMVLLLIFVFVGANFVAVVFLTWMPTFLYQKFHMSLSMAGLNATAYLQIVGAVCLLRRPSGRPLHLQDLRWPTADAILRTALRRAVPFSHRLHDVGAVAHSRDDRLRLLQRPV